MPQNVHEILNAVFMMLGMVCLFAVLFLLVFRRLKDRYAPVQTVKAQVVDKYVADQFSKIYGSMARSPQYYVVFATEKKKYAFRVSQFSYNGYKIHQRGTLKYRGSRILSFK